MDTGYICSHLIATRLLLLLLLQLLLLLKRCFGFVCLSLSVPRSKGASLQKKAQEMNHPKNRGHGKGQGTGTVGKGYVGATLVARHPLLTSINVTLQVRGYPMPCIVELQMQTQPQQGRVLLHQLRDLHLDLVAEHL